ncbi:GNAT family N-acetyltransferase [Altericista sp. CCNU0014]|uniref:GNAT family N-acetyltransferase n=1 Tax=Altericista sp. CCNU0014 TaxID=3082949 RepID=UPI00384B0C19
MDCKFLTSDDTQWSEALKQFKYDFYHLPDYVKLEADRQNAAPEAIYLSEGDCALFLPYLRRSCASILQPQSELDTWDIASPYGYPGPLLNSVALAHSDFIRRAFSALIEILRDRGICTAFIRLHPLLNATLNESVLGQIYQPLGETVWIDLTQSEEQIWSQTIAKHRNRINHCKRLGFSAQMVPVLEYLDDFIEIYHATMNRVVATSSYYFDKSYFEALAASPQVHLCLVRQESRVACAGLFLECCGTVQFHLSGTHPDFLKPAPSKLMLDFVRSWAKNRGNSAFHLGGGLGSAKDSLFEFKAGFSPLRSRFAVLKAIANQPLYLSLIEQRARAIQSSPQGLMESGFFPAYRSG